jgi:hypothetical protein
MRQLLIPMSDYQPMFHLAGAYLCILILIVAINHFAPSRDGLIVDGGL